MTSLISTAADTFLSHLQEIHATLSLSALQTKAWERFVALGLASKKHEAFTYVPLRQLYEEPLSCRRNAVSKEAIAKYIYPECRDSALVFIDGVFSLDHSSLEALPSAVTLLRTSQAEKGSFSSFLQKRLQQKIAEETDPFALLSIALSPEGAFVFIPPATTCSPAIQCLFVSTEDKEASFARAHIVLGEKAHADIITTQVHLGQGGAFFHNAYIDVSLDNKASCTHSLYLDVPKKSWSFTALRASLKQESKIDCYHLSSGSKSTRGDYHIALTGEGASATISGLSWLEEGHQSHANILVDHRAPHCISHQYFKGVLSDSAQSSFTGKILVQQIAQKTQAYQLNNNLLLTEGTIANSKPGLEILADDVKASHGATVSQLDEEALFYLKSRGLSEALAKTLLIQGFCKDIVQGIPSRTLADSAIKSIESYVQRRGP